MIQRQQTLWLLLATAATVMSFLFPFATGTAKIENTSMEKIVELDAGSNFQLVLLSIASVAISFITIFLFKNRKQQQWLCLLGLLISGLIVFFFAMEMNKLIKPTPALWAVLPVLTFISYFMAYRGVRKDEKLVKSLDKLR